jgi:hypothetical protein
MVVGDWKRNKALLKWMILLISIPFIAMFILGIFISWYRDYNPLSFISSTFLEFIFSPYGIVILPIITLLILSSIPIRYRITLKGIGVKFIGRKTKGLILWSDIEKLDILKISGMIHIYRKSTNFPTFLSYDLDDLEIMKEKIKKPFVFT